MGRPSSPRLEPAGSRGRGVVGSRGPRRVPDQRLSQPGPARRAVSQRDERSRTEASNRSRDAAATPPAKAVDQNRKSTRLNSSHQIISYAVFCLKKKNATLTAIN